MIEDLLLNGAAANRRQPLSLTDPNMTRFLMTIEQAVARLKRHTRLPVAARRPDQALALLTWAQAHRCDDGSYWTGIVYPERETFPFSERTTYTAGAIVLAADALSNATPAAGLFRGESLPDGLDLTEPRREAPPA